MSDLKLGDRGSRGLLAKRVSEPQQVVVFDCPGLPGGMFCGGSRGRADRRVALRPVSVGQSAGSVGWRLSLIARSTLANFGAREDTVCRGSRMPGGGRALGESSLRHGFHLLNLYMGWFRLLRSGSDLQRDTLGRNYWLLKSGNVNKWPLLSQVLSLAKCPTSVLFAVG